MKEGQESFTHKDNKIEQKNFFEKGLKIVVGGPPHSGKSVFLDGLLKNLPYNTHYFSGCPDGEGPWLQRHYTEDEVKALRRKGSFTEEFVNFAHDAVKDFNGQLMLIDIGGRITPENMKIISGATHAIILSGDTKNFDEWNDFFKKEGIEIIAKLHSDYNGKEDTITEDSEQIQGSVHYLERGQHPEDRESIKFVAEHIAELVKKNEEKRNISLEDNNELLKVDSLAFEYNLKANYDKETVPGTLTGLQKYLKDNYSDSKQIKIDGRINSYLAGFLGTELADGERKISFNSPNGFVGLKELNQSENGSVIDWEQKENITKHGDSFLEINFKLDPSKPFKPEDLSEMNIPKINTGEIVSIGGKGPHWLRTSIAIGYKKDAQVIAMFIPGEGSIVVHSKDIEKYPLGTLLENK